MTIAALRVAGHLPRIAIIQFPFVRGVGAAIDGEKPISVLDDRCIAADQGTLRTRGLCRRVESERRIFQMIDEKTIHEQFPPRSQVADDGFFGREFL